MCGTGDGTGNTGGVPSYVGVKPEEGGYRVCVVPVQDPDAQTRHSVPM